MPFPVPVRPPRFSLAILFACTLVACGGGDDDLLRLPPVSAPNPTPDPPAPPPPPACTDPATQVTRGAVANGPAAVGTQSRPQLNTADAAAFTRTTYLAQAGVLGALVTDDWDPAAGVGNICTFTPTFVVAADGSGTHTTVQAALDAVPLAKDSRTRVYILVKPGTYRGQVCVRDKAPITLYGASAAEDVVFVDNKANGTAKAVGAEANPCNPNASAVTYGTSGSASFAIYSQGFQAKNLTFANDFDETTTSVSGKQAVALMTQAD